jgi:hypothetical protein
VPNRRPGPRSARRRARTSRARPHGIGGTPEQSSATGWASCAPVPTFSMRPPATSSAAAVSAAPWTSGMPGGNPSAALRSSPAGAADGCTGASSGSDRAQRSPARSQSRVAEASLGSVAAGAPRARRSQSLGCSAQRARSGASGSCRASQARIGPANPGAAGFPGETQPCASRTARPSAQRIAGRTGTPAVSHRTTPCICPESPIAATSHRPACASAAPTAEPAASSQPSARASAHPGAGTSTTHGARPVASTDPSSPASSAFTADVPTSRPRYARRVATPPQ